MMTYDEARTNLRQATQAIIGLEHAYEMAVERSADAEAVYRAQLAAKLQAHREGGKAVQEADTLARADVATLSRERDYAAGMLKLAHEKLDDARDSRRSLWRLIEWSARVDAARTPTSNGGPAQMPLPENAPPERWP